MAWLALLTAGSLEIAWILGLKYSDGFTRFWPSVATLLAIAASFAMLSLSLKSVPFGTAYAVWTGIGAAERAAGPLRIIRNKRVRIVRRIEIHLRGISTHQTHQ